MPYQHSDYTHHRRRSPDDIRDGTFRTVPITHTKATGTYPEGTLARIGISKKTGNEVIQSVLVPTQAKRDEQAIKRTIKKRDIDGMYPYRANPNR